MFELRPGILGHILAAVEIDRLALTVPPVVIIAVDLGGVHRQLSPLMYDDLTAACSVKGIQQVLPQLFQIRLMGG